MFAQFNVPRVDNAAIESLPGEEIVVADIRLAVDGIVPVAAGLHCKILALTLSRSVQLH